MVCFPLFLDHVVRSKTADLKYFRFCLGRPPLTLSATPSEFALAVSSPLDKLPFFLFVTEFCNLFCNHDMGLKLSQFILRLREQDDEERPRSIYSDQPHCRAAGSPS